jgi:hypothetical protein
VSCQGTWTNWAACTATCGVGSRSRTFTVSTPPANGGLACPSSPQTQACNLGQCPQPMCSPLTNPDTAMYDTSACSSTSPPNTQCIVKCILSPTVQATYTCASTNGVPVWSGSLPRCPQQQCGELQSPNFYLYDTSGCTPGNVNRNCQVSCKAGHTGSSTTFSCTANMNYTTLAAWSGAFPTCTPIVCSAPSNPNPAIYNTSGCVSSVMTHNSACNVMCANGYVGAPAAYTCTVTNGRPTLSGNLPACVPATCPSLVTFSAGLDTSGCGSKAAVGARCTVYCAPGYTASIPSANFMCTAVKGGAAWTGSFPSCTGILSNLYILHTQSIVVS